MADPLDTKARSFQEVVDALPDDLTIDVRNQRITIASASHSLSVDIENQGRFGPFASGPCRLDRLKMMYLLPAFAQFSREKE